MVPSHLAEFYSHKKWCLALVICFVMELPMLPPLDYTVDYGNIAVTHRRPSISMYVPEC